MSDTATAPERPFTIVLGLDLGDQESSGYALQQAARIGSRISNGAMHVVHVAPADTGADEVNRLAGLLKLYVSESASALGMTPAGGLGLHVRQWWCARHSEHHHLRRLRIYSYADDWSFAEHDSEVSATGTD